MAEKDIATITMADKFNNPPAYGFNPEKKKPSQKTLWGLMFYAGAVTAALITVCVFESIAGQSEDKFQLGPDVKHYQSPKDENGVVDDVDLDVGRDREVFRKTTADGMETITVLDFGQGIGGIYHAPTEKCFLMHDIEGLPHAAEIIWNIDNKQSGVANTTVNYVVDTTRPVSDMSLVPAEMVTPCWGKTVQWLDRDTHLDHAGRHKRAWIVYDCDCYQVEGGWLCVCTIRGSVSVAAPST